MKIFTRQFTAQQMVDKKINNYFYININFFKVVGVILLLIIALTVGIEINKARNVNQVFSTVR